jgi:hypothetical protein
MNTLNKTQQTESPMDSGAIDGDTARGPSKWSEEKRRSWRAWRNYHLSLPYARGDRHTFYLPIDWAAEMAGCSRRNFYDRYLQTGRLPYELKTWFHGRKMRRKSFVPRAALMKLLTRELLETARRQLLRRRSRPLAIRRKATVADLERELELGLPRRSAGNKR